MNVFIKRGVIFCCIALLAFAGMINDAEARRMGGGKSSGMNRSSQQYNSPNNNYNSSPANNAQRNQQTGATATNGAQAPAAKNKWLGPVAGLAAGLGIAALLSHFGLGEGLANIMTLMLMIGLGFIVLRFILNAFAKKAQPAPASGYNNASPTNKPDIFARNTAADTPVAGSVGSMAGHSNALKTPSNVNPEEFLRAAKGFFIRMQAANDKKDVADLRRLLTPEMFAEAQLQINERGNTEQTTEIIELNGTVVSLVTEDTHDIGSVRFTGRLKCSDEAFAEDFDEVWHFTKWSNHTEQWSLAGIQQN